MSISLETLALARKYVGKATGGMEQEIAGKGDTLEYDGSTLTLKSGNKTLSSVTVEGGGGGGGLQYKIVQSIDEIQPAEEGADEYVYLVKKEKAGDHDSYDESRTARTRSRRAPITARSKSTVRIRPSIPCRRLSCRRPISLMMGA